MEPGEPEPSKVPAQVEEPELSKNQKKKAKARRRKEKVKLAACPSDSDSENEYLRMQKLNIQDKMEALKKFNLDKYKVKEPTKINKSGEKTEVIGGEPRRSTRPKKKVDYVGAGCEVESDGDEEYHPEEKDLEIEPRRNKYNLRKKMPVPYAESDALADPDDYIFCSDCKMDYFGGCKIKEHELTLMEKTNYLIPDESKYNLGLINRGATILRNTVIGPYKGEFVPWKDHEYYKNVVGYESGYAWELMDSSRSKMIGVVDPGKNPNPVEEVLAFVNCSSNSVEQNCEAFQYMGEVYYKVTKSILYGQELLVYYGDHYAKHLGIEVSDYKKYRGREDWTSELYDCKNCNSGFTEKYLLDAHQSKGKCKPGATKFECPLCSKIFFCKDNLKKHIGTHKEGKYKCTNCEKEFAREDSLKVHIDSIHKGIRFPCDLCDYEATKKSHLKRHRKTHTGIRDQKCSVCGVTFTDKSHLNRHMKCVHEKIQDFLCVHCPAKFSQSGDLKVHIDSVHLGIRHNCDICQKSFSKSGSLARHKKSEHGDRKFSCPLCPHKFAMEVELNGHMKNSHKKEWEEKQEHDNPFPCSICGKRFATQIERSRHKKYMHRDD